MNLQELDSYNLSDAVKFHNRLNPKIWGADEKLLPEVQQKLLEIAADFQEFLGINDLAVEDITVSGSNAAYSYTPHSDIDLHLVVRMPEEADEVYQELFNAKKYQYNDLMNIKIHGADVELYVQPADESPVSLGEYSIKNSQWLQVPRRKRAKIDHSVVKHKYEDIKARIESALKENNSDRVQALIDKIKAMRQSGLDAHGEFGAENLAFKMLRSQGYIKKLYDHRAETRARELSLKEQNKPREQFRWGFSEGHQGQSYSSEDGVSPTTAMFVTEDNSAEDIVREFIQITAQRLGIERMPEIVLHNDDAWSTEHHSFGMYVPDTHTLHVNLNDRHILDILRTTAHELAHCRQNEISKLPDDAGKTGSPWEDEAHAVAGEIMRDYADANPDMFSEGPVNEASGYIPKNKKEARDPRYSMAVTVDIKPGQVGKEANKLALHTGRNGEPALLMKSANLRESRMPQPSQGQGKYRDLNAPLGPEFKPTMPKGTVRVDVSDVYDWYKLGKDIPNLDRAKPSDYGKGPPSTIVSFGDENTEHKYIDNLKKLGLTTTDIDPVDPDQPKGMKRQKVDPTYNVAEDLVKSLAEEFELLEDEFLGEVKMSTASLRQEAAKTGAQAGMEFEMIVPDVGLDDQEPEWEPDYDQDQRARSFSKIEDFFHDGDYNGRGEIRRLMENLDEAYRDWQYEQTAEAWIRDGIEFMQDYISLNDLFDRDEAMLAARDEVMDANPDLPQESEDFTQLLSARLDEMEREFARSEYENQGTIYNDAFEAFSDEQADEYDEGSFLDDKYPYMSDIQNEFDISWPYYTDMNDNDGGADIEQVADEFSSYMGKPVKASKRYHGVQREPGTYIVEPDGSLEGDNPGDEGLEFVSPPMPIDEMLSDLNKVKAWAGEQGCYTNDSTGLHINISVPNYSLDKLDYVKLALLMGDEYVLELFGRSGNSYAKAATGKIKTMLKNKPELAPQIMDKMRGHMEDFATKAIHSGTTDKYTSINTKSGYIEFRSPGGDWLDANFDKIENTLLRFTVALAAAIDPQAYRKEYLKKLYKLLEGSQEKGGVDVLQLFANYSAGELDKAALIRQVREKQLARDLSKGRTPPGQKYWWNVSRPGYFASIEIVASSKEEAINKAVEPGNYPDWAAAKNTLQAKPLRPYQEPQAPNQNGNWGIWMSGPGRFARAPGQIDNSVLRRFPSREAAEQWIAQTRSTNSALRTDIEVREIEPAAQTGSRNTLSQTDIENRLGWPDQTGDANYEVVDRNTGRPVFVFIANTDYDARRKYADLLAAARIPIETDDYTFREIRPAASGEFRSTETVPREGQPRNLVPTGPGPWEIYRLSDNSSVRPLSNTSRPEAEQEARSALGLRGEAPELYGVRTRQAQAQAQPQQQTFTGEWDVVMGGEVVFRVPGENQGIANNAARQWVLARSPEFLRAHQGQEVEVVPRYA